MKLTNSNDVVFFKPPRIKKYYAWMKRQKDRDDPIGDLARDILDDINFPRKSNEVKTHSEYLISQGACDHAIKALYDSWKEYIEVEVGKVRLMSRLNNG